jgi:hypothetical protein
VKVKVGAATFVPDVDENLKKRILTLALQQVAQRVAAVQPNLTDLSLDGMAVEMPIPLEHVKSGYYTDKAAADFLANRIFKMLLPHLHEGARNQDILFRSQVYGSDTGFHHVDHATKEEYHGPPMTVQHLHHIGLTPKRTVEVDGVRYHLSDPIQMGGRIAYVAYVEQGGQVHVRCFYTSQSQGVWRSASHRKSSGKWIGKGCIVEESTDLPWELYPALNAGAAAPRQDIPERDAEGIFYGLLKVDDGYFITEDYQAPGEMRSLGTFKEKAKALGKDFGKPESFEFADSQDAPDFSKVVSTFTTTSSIHPGTLTAYVFASKNGNLSYLFYRDAPGRCWLGSVQDSQSMITSRGNRMQVINPGDLTMPLHEYHEQIPQQYRGPAVDDHYSDAWAYLRRLPMMAELYQTMGWSMPLPRRSRSGYKKDDYVRVPRTTGISWAQITALDYLNGAVTVLVPAPDGQKGEKQVLIKDLLPCYREQEQVNVPRSSGPTCIGVILQVAWATDQFLLGFVDAATGQDATKWVTGAELDPVN